MLYVLYAIFFIACVVLIGSVLLQPGKTDAGALFTSNISNAAFGPRGTASVLGRITIVAASVFMVAALLISMPALQGNISVLQSVSESPASEAPSAPADAVVDTNSNAAVTDPGAANASNAVPASNSNAGQSEANK